MLKRSATFSFCLAWSLYLPVAIGQDTTPKTHNRATAVMDQPLEANKALAVDWRSVAFTTNGELLVGSGGVTNNRNAEFAGIVAAWETKSGKLKNFSRLATACDLAMSNDNKTVIGHSAHQLLRGSYSALMIWALDRPKPDLLVVELNATNPIIGHEFLFDGKRYATATPNGFYLWDYSRLGPFNPPRFWTFGPARTMPAAKSVLDPNQFDRKVKSSLGISSEDPLWIFSLQNGEVEAWDLKTGKLRFQIGADGGAIQALAIADKEKVFAVAKSVRGGANLVEIRGLKDGNVIASLNGLPSSAITDLSINTSGTFLAGRDASGAVTVWDVNSRNEIDRLEGPSPLKSVLISNSGATVATTDESSVRIWQLDRLRKLAANDKQDPSTASTAAPTESSAILARGPITVTLTMDRKSEDRELLGLTPQKLTTRKTGELGFIVDTASSGKVKSIVSSDNKLTWKLSQETKEFSGPVYTPEPDLPQVTPRQFSSAQLETYLYLGFQRYKNRGSELVHDPINEAELAEIQASLTVLAKLVRDQKLNDKLGHLYERLRLSLETASREVKNQRQVLADYEAERQKANQQKEVNRRKYETQRLLGFAAMFIGAMPTTTAVTDAYGNTWNVETGIVDQDLFEQGLTTMFSASLEESRNQQQLAAAERLSNETMRKRLMTAMTAEKEALDGVQLEYEGIVGEPFGIRNLQEISVSDLKVPDVKTKTSAFAPLLEKLENRSAAEQMKLGGIYPFTQSQIEAIQSVDVASQDMLARIRNIRACADRIARLADLVPKYEAFDFDRAELLTRAGTLALRAANDQIGSQRWCDAFNEHADAAQAYFNRALAYAPEDSAGRRREQLALAYFLSGRGAEGLKLSDSITQQRTISPRFSYQLARALCSMGQVDKGYFMLEDAVVERGFDDLLEAQKAADFKVGDLRLVKLMQPKVKLLPFNTSYRQGNGEFEIVNLSKFPLRNAKVKVVFRGTDAKGKVGDRVAERIVDLWKAGDKVSLKVALDNQVAFPNGKRASPVAQVSVVTPKVGNAVDKYD